MTVQKIVDIFLEIEKSDKEEVEVVETPNVQCSPGGAGGEAQLDIVPEEYSVTASPGEKVETLFLYLILIQNLSLYCCCSSYVTCFASQNFNNSMQSNQFNQFYQFNQFLISRADRLYTPKCMMLSDVVCLSPILGV